MTVRVLLVDDHAVLIEGLTMVLAGADQIDVVGAASGGAQGVERYQELLPDVVLMDLSMPDVDGVEATRQIRRFEPNAKVIVLTGFVDDRLVADALTAGAAGYLLKDVSGDELSSAILAVAAGGSIVDADALRRFMISAQQPQLGDDLTTRELEVLSLLVHGMTNQQIADELGLQHGTVRIHVSNILSKLHVDNRTSAAHLALTEGLVARPR